MNKNKIITIIIPTYNMEKYLSRCLDTLIVHEKEFLDLIEILVINDGSRDSSLEIARRYESYYPESIRVVDKENGNYGSCVNRGLKEATGKYVKVIDADDYVLTHGFCELIKELQIVDADLIITDYDVVGIDGNVLRKWRYKLPKESISDFEEFSASWDFKHIQMHAIAYRRELLIEMNYTQTEGISYTDQEWMFYPMSKVKTFYYCATNVYQYVLGREGQTMDETQIRRNIDHFVKILYRQLSFLSQIEIKGTIYTYLKERSFQLIKTIYQILISTHHDSLLKEIDQRVSRVNFDLFQEMKLLKLDDRFWPFEFISHWREGNKIKLYVNMKGFKLLTKLKHIRFKS